MLPKPIQIADKEGISCRFERIWCQHPEIYNAHSYCGITKYKLNIQHRKRLEMHLPGRITPSDVALIRRWNSKRKNWRKTTVSLWVQWKTDYWNRMGHHRDKTDVIVWYMYIMHYSCNSVLHWVIQRSKPQKITNMILVWFKKQSNA